MTAARASHWRVWLLGLAAVAVVAALLLAGIVWFLLSTERGARWVIGRVGVVIPGSLEVDEITGTLRGPLAVRGLHYRNEGLAVTVGRAALAWRLGKLLQRQLDIVSFEIEGVRVVTAESEEPSEPLELPDVHLPINIIVRQARVRDVELTSTGGAEAAEPFTLDSIDLSTRAIGDVVEIEQFVVRSPQLTADVTGRVEPQGDYPVDLRLKWSVRLLDQPRWAGAGTLSGSLEDLGVRHRLTAPVAARVDARLSKPLRDLGFDATLQAPPFALATLGIDLPGLTAGGRVHATGSVESFRGEARLIANYEGYGRAHADLAMAREGDLWRVDRLVLTRPQAPTRVEARGEATLAADTEPSFSVDAAWRDLAWPLDGEPVARSAEGRLHAAGTFEAFRGEAKAVASYEGYGTAHADLVVARQGERWQLAKLEVTSPESPTHIEATGDVTLAPDTDPRFSVDASWRDLSWPLTGEPIVRSPTGRASVAGRADAYDLEIAGRLITEPLGPTPFRLAGSGGRERLAIQRARADLLAGTVTARGEVAWQPRVEWRLAVDGTDLDPAALWPDGAGKLSLTARTAGHLEEAGAFARVAPLHVSGTLRGEPLAADAAVNLSGERLTLRDLDLAWGSLRLAASGRMAPSWAFRADLEAPDLTLLSSEAEGSLTARARLNGPQTAPHIEVSATGAELGYGDLSAATLTVDADVDLSAGGVLALAAAATRVAAGERMFRRVGLTGEGSREAHRLTATVDGVEGREGESRLHVAARGGLSEEDAWHGELSALDVELPEAGRWSLASPVAVTASAETVELERLCEVSAGARVCAEGIWRSADGWQADTELTALPLALAQRFLPPELTISGTLDGRIEASADASGVLSAAAQLELGAGEVTYAAVAEGLDTLRFGPGSLDGAVDDDGTRAELSLPLPDLGQAEAELALPGYRATGAPDDGQAISARLNAEISDLSFLQAFSDQLTDTGGRITADLRLGGTLGQPRIDGEARLAEARAAVPALSIQLTDLWLSAVSRGGESLRLEGGVRSGDGALTLNGEVPPAPDAERPIRLAVRGERFTAMDTREIHLLASPDLELTYDGTRMAVDGEVRVPEAKVDIAKPPPGVVTASEDVVLVGGDPTEEATGPPLAMRVRVVLGDEVEIAVLGLQAEPTGSLLLIERPGEPTAGTGEIELNEGTFNAYGQDLTIERGRLIFAGPVDDPGIDLRAYREARDGVVAGLEARRTLSRPEITLWSEPPMDQANQLSYILLGRPVGQASPADENRLANAALAMGLKRGNVLGEKLASRFGLEEVRVEAGEGLDQASLVLGRYLSPRLYVAYGVGLFEAADSLRIRYLLSRRWALEATTGTAAGADLLYTIERGE
ncbi:MAG: translocation/assembly module TamB domain-containing protein [Thermoanaerobaculia bacterium]